MTRGIPRVFLAFNGLLLVIGGLLWMNGGRQHPTISQAMGTFGTDAFFWEFAKLMIYTPGWRQLHEQMMVAPLLWSIGVYAIVLMARRAGERHWTPLGFMTLATGGILWILTYMYDGLVSPETAKALLASEGNATLTAAITQTFASGQWFTIRISMYAWMLIAVGTALLSIGLIAMARRSRGALKLLSWGLAVLGLVLGAWSLIAWATGAYAPGPMVSLWWMPAAIATQFWYLLLGILVLLHAVTGARSNTPTAVVREATRPVEAPVAERAAAV